MNIISVRQKKNFDQAIERFSVSDMEKWPQSSPHVFAIKTLTACVLIEECQCHKMVRILQGHALFCMLDNIHLTLIFLFEKKFAISPTPNSMNIADFLNLYTINISHFWQFSTHISEELSNVKPFAIQPTWSLSKCPYFHYGHLADSLYE